MKRAKRTKAGSGQLLWSGKGWSARYWAVVDGERVRRCASLGTDNRAVAAAKLARLVSGEDGAASARTPETFEQAARRIVASQGIKTSADRLSRLERFAFGSLGKLAVTDVRPAHVRVVLDGAVARGRSRTTVSHLRDDISTVLGELWRDEVVTENVALRAMVPKRAAVDDRKRVVLTDAEFEQFMACPDVSPELHTMALVARTFGGMRTSDLHAWSWEHVDLVDWLDAHVPRPKTKSSDRLALPGMLVAPLQTWWDAAGRPATGPVFPERNGERAGERRSKRSHARRLRAALWTAGVRRGATLQACELQTDTATSRRVDFHSLRRAFNTALASAGVNVQQAMRLAGHRNASTHMRYVLLAERLEMPLAALPKLSGNWLALAASVNVAKYARPQRDLNPCYRRERPAGPSAAVIQSRFDARSSANEHLSSSGQSRACPSGLPSLGAPRELFDAGLADLVLGTALRGLADRSALAQRAALVGGAS